MGNSRYHRRFEVLVPLVALWLVICALPSARSEEDDEGANAVTGVCEVSNLAGYKYAVDLSGNGLYLHWAPKGTTEMDFAIEARPGSGAESTWVSVGWSAGRMAPADAVMGNLAGNKVAAYSIQGYDMGSLSPTTAFALASTAVLTSNGGSTVSKFTRTIGDGDFPVAPDQNTLIWAFSGSGSQGLDYHGGNVGIVNIDFTCASGAAPATGAPDSISGGGSGSSSGSSSGGGGGGASCPASSLTGFDYQAELTPGLLLHWKQASSKSLDMALEATASGGAAGSWVSVAWTGDGRMVPSDAVIGNLPGGAAGAYAISGYDVASVSKTSTFSVGAASTETSSGGSAIVKFTRMEGEGSIPMSLSAPNALIWAYSGSRSQSLDYHGSNYGSKTRRRQDVPSDAVIGNLASSTTKRAAATGSATGGGATVAAYSIAGYSESDVAPATAALPLAATAVETSSNGKTVVKFSRVLMGGKFPIDTSAPTNLIWAYSADGSKKLANHGGNRYVLHWNATGDNIAFAAVATAGWVSLGWSADGKMYPAEAVIGNLPATSTSANSGGATVSSYSIAGYSETDVTPTAATGIALAATAVDSSANGKTVVKFTRATSQGKFRSVRLGRPRYILHWKANTTTISFAAEVATSGWVSLGWNSNGKMQPADAAIGNQPAGSNSAAVAPYSITGYSGSDISATSAFALSGTTVESAANGKTVVKFTRPMAGGSYPINTNGPTTIIWAYSADGSQTLANHGPNCGSAQIDFISGSAVSTSSSSSSVAFIIHGWLLGIAFGILMPAAILISRIFLADKLQEKPPGVDPIQWEAQVARAKSWKPMAFETHKWMQITAVVLAIVGCIIGMVESGSVGLKGTHGQLGIAIFVMIFIQPVIVGLAWVNTFLGFDAMTVKFASDMQVYFIIFAIAIGLFAAIYVVIFVVDQVAFIIARLRPAADEGREKMSFQV
ncbi:unnamed protein product [Closterium sp. Yama58-4]|nr:unnamed protein product [Closterium sp. Yama58-4]